MKQTGDKSASSSPAREQAQTPSSPSTTPPRHVAPTEGQAVFALYQHLRHVGVVTTIEQVINLYLSLKTVPILVLDGPAGVGKDLVARTMCEGMGTQFAWLPMTNETGSGPANAPLRLRDLLGQTDAPSGQFRPEPLFEALLAARENPDIPHVICLDTIDGWQEDAWLSEYVRLLDSQEHTEDGRWASMPIIVVPGYETLQTVDGKSVPARFPLPDNVFLMLTTMGRIGLGDITVERSNVVELGPADLSLDAVRPGHEPEGTTAGELGRMLVTRRTHRTIGDILDRPWVEAWNEEIMQVSGMLEEMDLGIGYRLRDDILRYLAYADDLNAQFPYGISFPLDVAFDHQLAQRVVTRLFTREPDDDVVSELLMYAQGSQDHGTLRFPRTAAQLGMLQRRME